jgi:hypothetical protein
MHRPATHIYCGEMVHDSTKYLYCYFYVVVHLCPSIPRTKLVPGASRVEQQKGERQKEELRDETQSHVILGEKGLNNTRTWQWWGHKILVLRPVIITVTIFALYKNQQHQIGRLKPRCDYSRLSWHPHNTL